MIEEKYFKAVHEVKQLREHESNLRQENLALRVSSIVILLFVLEFKKKNYNISKIDIRK